MWQWFLNKVNPPMKFDYELGDYLSFEGAPNKLWQVISNKRGRFYLDDKNGNYLGGIDKLKIKRRTYQYFSNNTVKKLWIAK